MDNNNLENHNNYSDPASGYGASDSPNGTNGSDTGYSYGNTSYGDNSYGNTSYGDNSYGDNSYGTNSYGNNSYSMPQYGAQYGTPYGGTPRDENGNPLKNRFGMKMVFSILEILSCCLGSLITTIFGIIALVFTCKANTSYKEGDTRGFKSSAKVSAVLLWIGLAIDAIILILWFTVIGPFYFKLVNVSVTMLESGMSQEAAAERLEEILYDMIDNGDLGLNADEIIDKYLPELSGSGSDWNDANEYDGDDFNWNTNDDYSDEEPSYADSSRIGEYWSFQLDGNSYTLPFAASDFTAKGYMFDEGLENISIDPDDYTIEYFYSPDGEAYLGAIQIYNPTDQEIAASEGTIVAVYIINDLAYGGSYEQELLLYGGITFDSTREDAYEVYGAPTFTEEDEENPQYDFDEWVASEEDYYNENYFDIMYENGMISDVMISYMGE